MDQKTTRWGLVVPPWHDENMGFIYKYLSELTLKDKSNRFYQLHFFTFPRNSLLFQELILQLASYERWTIIQFNPLKAVDYFKMRPWNSGNSTI